MSIFSSEKEFEDQLYAYIVKHQHNPISGRRVESILRQPNLGWSGIPDLITLEVCPDGNQFIHVMELKNTEFHRNHIFQVAKYMSVVSAAINWHSTFYGQAEVISPKVIPCMFPGAELEGSILVTGQESFEGEQVGLDGVLHLCNVTVYSLVIRDLQLEFIPLLGGKPCSGAAEAIQPALTALSCPLEEAGHA